jgi:hypothetical protein
VLQEQAPELTFAHAEALCESFYTRVFSIERALSNQRQGAGYSIRSAAP